MTTAAPTATIISKSSTISIGLMVVIMAALAWQAASTATMRAELGVLPMMQKDIREIRDLLARNDGGDQRQDAEHAALKDRVGRLETRIRTLEGKKQ